MSKKTAQVFRDSDGTFVAIWVPFSRKFNAQARKRFLYTTYPKKGCWRIDQRRSTATSVEAILEDERQEAAALIELVRQFFDVVDEEET